MAAGGFFPRFSVAQRLSKTIAIVVDKIYDSKQLTSDKNAIQPCHAHTANLQSNRSRLVYCVDEIQTWQSGAVPPQFPSHACDTWCQSGANLCRPCRFGRLYRLISCLFSITQATDTSWHGRGHRFGPDQVENHFNRLETQSQRWADCYILFSQL